MTTLPYWAGGLSLEGLGVGKDSQMAKLRLLGNLLRT